MANGPQGLRIERMWAWTTIDPDDQTEGVIGIKTPEGWLPMVGADRERMESLRPYVRALVEDGQFTATLAQFSTREEIDRITPADVTAHERKG